MSTQPLLHDDCECCRGVTRRTFLKTTMVGAATVAAAGPLTTLAASQAGKAAVPKATSETLVATLHKSLTEGQKKSVCFSFDHPLRSKVDNNWMITDKKISQFFTNDQQAMIRDIFTGLNSPEYAERVLRQVEHDGGKEGFGGCSIALFGEPGTGKFEFVLSGRHVTRRCDGDSVEGAAFGGPIFYGHAARSFNETADHPGNVYWYQAVRANEVFKMLDGKQRELALLEEPREEKGTATVKLTGRTDLPGIPVGALARDQKEQVRKVMADVLAPFRKPDADEALKLIEKNGFDSLHMSFYKNEDIGHDGVWDIWQIEGPAMLWFFRGAPHVHTWVHVREKA